MTELQYVIEFSSSGRLCLFYAESMEHARVNGIVKLDNCVVNVRDGIIHNENGPSVVFAMGTVHFHLDGKYKTFDEFIKETTISDEEKLIISLKYA